MSSATADKHSLSDPPNPPEPWGWTRRQRIGLGILLGLLVTFLAIGYLRRPAQLDEPAQLADSQPLLLQLLDPNTATAAELARVPHLGDTLAARIVSYRQARQGTAGGGIVFRTAHDLDAVPGIGPKLVEQFAPFFKFPEEDATRP